MAYYLFNDFNNGDQWRAQQLTMGEKRESRAFPTFNIKRIVETPLHSLPISYVRRLKGID